MARFTIGAGEMGEELKSDFSEFVEIAKGRSIVSAGDWGKDRFELGLSGDLMIRIFLTGDTIQINLISTTNEGEIPPIAITLGDLSQRVPIHVIEDKLNGLRTLHAIYYLMQNGRSNELEGFLVREPEGDIERVLIADEDRLYIESISYGSWLLTVWAKTKSAYKSLSSVTGLVFERGKEAYLRKLEAEARMLENQAQKEAVLAAKENFELQRNQMDYILDMANKLDAPEAREQLKKRIQQSIDRLFLGNDHYDQRRIMPAEMQNVSVVKGSISKPASEKSYDSHTFVAEAALQPGKAFPLRCNCGGVTPIVPPLNFESVTCRDCGSNIRVMTLEGDPGYLLGLDPKTGREFLFQAQGSSAPSPQSLPPEEQVRIISEIKKAVQ